MKLKSNQEYESKINIWEQLQQKKKKKQLELVNRNGFPAPLKVKCFQCKKNTVEVKYVVPNKSYSKKNNWEYWTNPDAKNPEF